MTNQEIQLYNNKLSSEDRLVCDQLMQIIDNQMPEAESKIWHGHPVRFLDGNPIVGYSKQKKWVCLLFRSGQSFEETGLKPEGSFKAAQICYTNTEQINQKDLEHWIEKSKSIQWDYKNIVKRKGVLERLK